MTLLAILVAPGLQGVAAASQPPPPPPPGQQACADPTLHTQNKRQIRFPDGSEFTLTAWVCIYYEPGASYNQAKIIFDVGDGDDDWRYNSKDDFYFFNVQVRLESYNNVVGSNTRDWTANSDGINYSSSYGRHVCNGNYFYQPAYYVSPSMTADGTITYDIKGDGKGHVHLGPLRFASPVLINLPRRAWCPARRSRRPTTAALEAERPRVSCLR
jgi:hypothetical protein